MNEQRAIREGRLISLLQETVSRFLQETANKNSLISVSYITLNKSQRTATVHVSIFPEDQETRAFAFLKRRERDCTAFIRKTTALRLTPTIRFVLSKKDKSMAH